MNTSSHETPSPNPLAAARHELASLRNDWWWFLALGIAWVLVGMVALSSAVFATRAVVALFGLLMLIAGIAQVVSAIWAGRWSGFLLQLLVGIFYAVVGFVVFENPMAAAEALTLMISVFLLVGGIIRIVVALSDRITGWGWILLNGAVSTLLGIMILRGWPLTGVWVIGLFVGIEMIFNGWYWIMLALGIRNVPVLESEDAGL